MSNDKARVWYQRKAWIHKRNYQLKIEPLCRMCLAGDPPKINPATVADHIEPHNGDANLFWLGELQSLCFDHHNQSKQQIEVRGYSSEIAQDGFPVDKNHPFHKSTKLMEK